MKTFIKNNIKLISLLIVIILLGIIGAAFAFSEREISVGIKTGEYNVVYKEEEVVIPDTLSLVPDSEIKIDTSNNDILKIKFTVIGAKDNPTSDTDKPIIYDVSLTDLNLPSELKSEFFKWRLYKNNVLISEGNFEDEYYLGTNERMILTYTQQDLPKHSATPDSYVFYAWLSISEECANDITKCTEKEASYASSFRNKTFSGKIRIELSTGEKIVRATGKAGQTLVNLGLENSIQKDAPDLSKDSFNNCEMYGGISTCNTEKGIYSMKDDLGISYYFRGSVTNNYVKFGENSSGKDMFWRIIRINGDGTIRIIYDGTKVYENGDINKDNVVTTSVFNEKMDDNTYLGYMYGMPGVTITGEEGYNKTHSNLYDSTIKTYLEDEWYKNNIKETKYEEYIADAIYCNDRTLDTSNSSYTGIGTTFTYYAARERSPKLTCDRVEDRFTNETQNFDIETNGLLEAPVGLLTSDEYFAAGAPEYANYLTTNIYIADTYLYGQSHLTMTPFVFDINTSRQDFIFITGKIDFDEYYYNNAGVRPVISLKADALKYGDGTATNPFRVYE